MVRIIKPETLQRSTTQRKKNGRVPKDKKEVNRTNFYATDDS